MKYLLLILLSFSVFADVKVEIKRNNVVRYMSNFKTQQLADEWKADNIANDSWGKKERWVRFKNQTKCIVVEDVMKSIDDVSVPYPDPMPEPTQDEFGNDVYYAHPKISIVDYQRCRMPVQYTIIETDITAEENIKKDKLAACDVLSEKLKLEDLKLDELNKLLRCR